MNLNEYWPQLVCVLTGSLAELETFVLKSLVSKYPKIGKGVPGVSMFEPGKDLFSAFRPCYMRAYTDAKDYKADTGAVIKV